MVVGCGALGNEVLKQLALCRIGHLTLIDFDRVEEGNLRCSPLFRRSDVGRPKVVAMRQALSAINPDCSIDVIDGDIEFDVGLGIFRQQDLVIGCVDSRWARFIINRYCMRAGIPWIDGGITTREGIARMFMPGHNCYACSLTPEGVRDIRRRVSCPGVIHQAMAAGHAPTTPITSSIIAAVMVQTAVQYLANVASAGHVADIQGKDVFPLHDHLFSLDADTMVTRLVAMQAFDDMCPEHDVWQVDETWQYNGESLQSLFDLHPDMVLYLHNDPFVDYVSLREGDVLPCQVCCPARLVEAALQQIPEYAGRSRSELYQHEYRQIDASFPFKHLSLYDIGVPMYDVLHVLHSGIEHFIELTF